MDRGPSKQYIEICNVCAVSSTAGSSFAFTQPLIVPFAGI